MATKSLMTISPIDGRYANKTCELSLFFSEFGLIKYRVKIEIEYFLELCNHNVGLLKNMPKEKHVDIEAIIKTFDQNDALRIKEIEKTTNHDIKAVEYFIKEKFDAIGLQSYKEYIHIGLTSQDINNTALPLSIKDFHNQYLMPKFYVLVDNMMQLQRKWQDVPMLARTHGQPASPTSLGKEIAVFTTRLKNLLNNLSNVCFYGKFGGATGNFNAHHIAFPDIDWVNFSNCFLDKLGLKRYQITTQIEHYDMLGQYFNTLAQINVVLLDFCKDIWQYISMNYFKQKIKAGEVGSSAMPHKVNPIDFENAEGNLGIANALFLHLSQKLPVSRLQRDLTDSTVTRNIGVPIAHTSIALQSIQKGLSKLTLNQTAINKDLDDNWAVVAEAIQTFLRSIGYPNPYEALKNLTRVDKPIDKAVMHEFINGLNISNEQKEKLLAISPFNYTGIKINLD